MIDFNQLETLPLSEQVERLQAEVDAVSSQSPIDTDYFNMVSNRRNEKKAALEAEQAQQERAEQQEQKIESIELPHNFNEVFDDPRANEIITELIKQFQRQAYDEHNVEIEKLHTYYKEQLSAAAEREVALKQTQETTQIHLNEALSKNATLLFEKEDAESKRDAASNELKDAKTEIERLNGHINDLRKEAAVGAKEAYKVTDIGTSSKLDQLVKESAEAKANRALERWSKMLPEIVAPPTPTVTESPFRPDDTTPQPSGDQLSATEATPGQVGSQFPTVQAIPTVDQGPSSVAGEDDQTPVTRAELKAEIARVKAEILEEVIGEKVA